jgi:1,2-phenylacetyl-CoA epoxidase catalytic subunit
MQFPYYFAGLYSLAPVDNFRYLHDIQEGFMQTKPKLQPFLVRLHPDTRAMLDRAAVEQRKSRAAIIDEAIRDSLADKYSANVNDRLDTLLGGR